MGAVPSLDQRRRLRRGRFDPDTDQPLRSRRPILSRRQPCLALRSLLLHCSGNALVRGDPAADDRSQQALLAGSRFQRQPKLQGPRFRSEDQDRGRGAHTPVAGPGLARLPWDRSLLCRISDRQQSLRSPGRLAWFGVGQSGDPIGTAEPFPPAFVSFRRSRSGHGRWRDYERGLFQGPQRRGLRRLKV